MRCHKTLYRCRVARNSTVCKALVTEAVRNLPQAKGKELQRLLKSHGLKSTREGNKNLKTLQQSSAPPAVEQVPADILGSVLDQLDPYSLAAAACASKQWQQEAYKDHRWRPFALGLVGTASASGQQGSWRELFSQAATGTERMTVGQMSSSVVELQQDDLYHPCFGTCHRVVISHPLCRWSQ